MLLEAVRSRVWATAALLATSILLACGGESTAPPPNPPPPPPPPPSPTTATVEVKPDSSVVAAGDTVRLTATVRDAQGNPMTGKSVSWSTTDAAIATISSTGLVTAVGTGVATISAAADGKSGSAAVRSFRPDTIGGAATDRAGLAISPKVFVARDGDYRADHPSLPGLPMSFNTVLISIEADATVGEINAALRELKGEIVGAAPAATASLRGSLAIRLATRSHAELIPRLEQLRTKKGIRRASPDVLLGPTELATFGAAAADWDWDLVPTGGNWGLEAVRAPQLWNLNGAVAASGRRTQTGVFDVGFDAVHDLDFKVNLHPTKKDDHGNNVAGIIAAKFDNKAGIEGITPFADLVVAVVPSFLGMADVAAQLIRARPDLVVINASLGYNWYKLAPPQDPRSDAAAQQLADDEGEMFADRLANLEAEGRRLPVIVAAAGNDGDMFPGSPAKYGSPFANAALVHGAAPIIVVEALDLGAGGSVFRAGFSEVGGHLAAPGVDIVTTWMSGYGPTTGTSVAAPFVAGLISYLYALDPALPAPTMTANPILDHLVATGVSFGSGAPMIDAFAAAMDLDRLHGNTRILQLLTDVDDGTIDGNLRVNPDATDNLDEDNDKNNQPGDGRIDMSDFRRWRDWLLLAERPGIASMDGNANHPKKDLNRDGRVSLVPSDNLYSRGDFNGDGEIHRRNRRRVEGVLAPQLATDLEVLQRLFTDPEYQAADLPTLIDSWDLTIDARDCLTLPQALTAHVVITPIGGTTPVATRRLDGANPAAVVTIKMSNPNVTVRVEARDGLGAPIGLSQVGVSGTLASDERYEPGCLDFAIATTSLPDGELSQSYTATLRSAGGTPPVSWSIVAGSLPPGLSLNPTTGAIAGTPTKAGTFSFTARARAGSLTAEQPLSILVRVPPLQIVGAIGVLPGMVGVPFDLRLVASGGDGVYRWTLVAGSLPAGISLDGATGRFTGTPTAAGTSNLTLSVASAGLTATGTLSVRINPPLRIYEGRYTDSNGGGAPSTRDAWLLVYPSAAGNTTCFLMMIPGRRLTNGQCRGGDLNAWEGTITGQAITATSTFPGKKPMQGTITDAATSLTGSDPFGKPLGFTSTARVP